MTDLTGRRLGDFEIVPELGRGGMGVVYEARQLSLNRPVALKVLAAGLAPRAVARFRREAETAAKLHHTNIVPVYATGEEGGTHYYAMELVDGPSLDRVIRAVAGGAAPVAATAHGLTGPYVEPTALTPAGSSATGSGPTAGTAYFDTVARMTADVADALDHAHQQGVLHRDVKPANLLLAPGGRLSVNDFGLARLLEQPGMTVTGEFVGTPAYMSPEQIASGRIPVDHRTDVYSLGATLYELLTLRPPFTADSRDRLLAMIVQKEPEPPRRVNPKVPVDLETICLKCLEKDPDRRYASAGDLAADLRRYVHRFAIAARRVGPVGRLRKWASRNPALAGAGLALLAMAVAAGVLAYRANRAERQRETDRARHQAELREERWRSALERAHPAALTGDVAGAEEGIRDAEGLGASPGQLALIRGVVAFYQGKTDEAIGHLEQAVGLLPDSVAAHALLAAAYGLTSQWGKRREHLLAADRLTAETPEDLLFQGYARSQDDPAGALPALDAAAARRPYSTVVRLIRAEARTALVLERADPADADVLRDDAEAVTRLLPGSAVAHRVSLTANTAAANTFQEHELTDRYKAALAAAERDDRVLRPLDGPAEAVEARWFFHREQDRVAELLPDLERVYAAGRDPMVAVFIAQGRVLVGRDAEAAKVLAPIRTEGYVRLLYPLVAASDPPGRDAALASVRDWMRGELAGWDLFNALCMLRLLGQETEAQAGARDLARRPDRFPPIDQQRFARTVEHLAGTLGDEAFLRAAGPGRTEVCNAQFCVGLARLAAGDRAGARKHFQAAVDTRDFMMFPYDATRMCLARMDRDPTWPAWLPAKK